MIRKTAKTVDAFTHDLPKITAEKLEQETLVPGQSAEVSMNKTIWTIGHSTRALEEFIDLLKSFQIELVADIRSFPGSRKFPQFNKEALEISLPQNKIGYIHIKNLGGRRKVNPDSKNTSWRHSAFRGYADYMETDAFKEGIKELEKSAAIQRTAFMCSEAVWWRCHRSMVSDYLKVHGWRVMHIMGLAKETEHPYTSPARIVDGELSYEIELKEKKTDQLFLFHDLKSQQG